MVSVTKHPLAPLPATSAAPVNASESRPSHSGALAWGDLNHQMADLLRAKMVGDNKNDKELAGLTVDAIRMGLFKLSLNALPPSRKRKRQDSEVTRPEMKTGAQYRAVTHRGTVVMEATLHPRDGVEFQKIYLEFPRGSALEPMILPAPSDLSRLPPELKQEIFGLTGNKPGGINPALRLTSGETKANADKKRSAWQHFVTENSLALFNLGYKDDKAITTLSKLTEAQRDVVLRHGETLLDLHYNCHEISKWAAMDDDQRKFVLNHGKGLEALGYIGGEMNDLAATRTPVSSGLGGLVLFFGKTLKNLGYSGHDINKWAKMNNDQRDFVLEQGSVLKEMYVSEDINKIAQYPRVIRDNFVEKVRTLKGLGYNDEDLREWATMEDDRRDAVLEHGETLKALNYRGADMNTWAALGEDYDDDGDDARNFVIDYGSRLQKTGYQPHEMNDLADMRLEQCDFVVADNNAETLQAAGYSGLDMNEWAGLDDADQRDFVLEHGQMLNEQGRTPHEINAMASHPDQRNAFLLMIGQ